METKLSINFPEHTEEKPQNKSANQQHQITLKTSDSNMELIEKVRQGATPVSISTKEMFPNIGKHCICNGQEWEIIGFLGTEFIIRAFADGNYAKKNTINYNGGILILQE